MVTLTDMFELNWVILYFVYGQVFFIMGLATWLSARRRSRLELARALPWLAAFGITHGLTEWGYIFVPLQAQYLAQTWIILMVIAHLFLLAVSFLCLLQFGVELLLPALGRRPWLRLVPASIFLLWAGATLLRWLILREPLNVLISIADGWSRYLLAFPGAILSHLGLLRQAHQVRAQGIRHIAGYLTGAAVAFSVYGIVGGLIVPAAPVFPASILNYALLQQVIHVPVPIFRSICGLAMAAFVVRSLEVFQIETDSLIERAERAHLLAADRERIGRDLHDGIIQNIYAAGLNLEDAQLSIKAAQSERAIERIRTIMHMLNQTIQDIRAYVFDLRAAEPSSELETVLGNLVHDLRLDTLVEVDLEVAGQRCGQITPQQVAHLTQIAREALSNVVQHAGARRATVSLHYTVDAVRLSIQDDGQGMGLSAAGHQSLRGQGVGNMQARARLMGSELTLESAPGLGLRVSVTVPCGTAP